MPVMNVSHQESTLYGTMENVLLSQGTQANRTVNEAKEH